jgi:hypothetical protein
VIHQKGFIQAKRSVSQNWLALEGIHKWVAFLPSRVDALRSVPNRYFGAMRDGKLNSGD